MKVEQIKELIENIDSMDAASVGIDGRLYNLRRSNQELDAALPEMDEEIEKLEAALAALEEQELNGESIVSHVLKPRSEIHEKIIKYQVKDEALQSTILGLKQMRDIDDVEEWLRQVRDLASSQFKTVYKRNKL